MLKTVIVIVIVSQLAGDVDVVTIAPLVLQAGVMSRRCHRCRHSASVCCRQTSSSSVFTMHLAMCVVVLV